MTIDCDELYDPTQFKWAMKDFEKGGYDTSFTQQQLYYKLPTMQLDPPDVWYQPLFYKIKKDTKFEMQENYPVHIDRTKMVKSGYTKIYTRDEIEQHHFAYVRHNLKSKVKNSSAQSDIKTGEQVITFFDKWVKTDPSMMIGLQTRGLKEVENKFNIKI